MCWKLQLIFAIALLFASQASACTDSSTRASGSHAPQSFCSGDLIFEDNFDNFDLSKWRHEQSMWGGGNYEFQWYVNDRRNSFASGGNLHLRPTYTSDIYGEDFLYNGEVRIPDEDCTNGQDSGCYRRGEGSDGEGIIPPVRSALVSSWDSFRFKYGTIEVRAKNPAGDWIWPAVWMMPRDSVYGGWPRSGEIDIMESRGNRQLWADGTHVGTEQVGSTLHFGPAWNINGWPTAHETKNKAPGYDTDYHIYKLIWRPFDLQFYIDDELLITIPARDGFWYRGGFEGENIWPNPMAPFDQEFYIILNNAVGGGFFGDGWENRPDGKTWKLGPRAMRDFWEGRWQWEPTWRLHNDDRDLKIDYVRVWAL